MNGGFRRAIVAATALVFATAFGWLACIQRMDSGEVEFHWQGSAWLWIAVGLAAPVYFWRQIWPRQPVSPARPAWHRFKGWAALLIPSLMWMLYPLRFISGQQFLNVLIGLGIAVTVLTLGGWMVFRLIKGFADEAAPPAKTDSARRPEAEDAPLKRTTNPPPNV